SGSSSTIMTRASPSPPRARRLASAASLLFMSPTGCKVAAVRRPGSKGLSDREFHPRARVKSCTSAFNQPLVLGRVVEFPGAAWPGHHVEVVEVVAVDRGHR